MYTYMPSALIICWHGNFMGVSVGEAVPYSLRQTGQFFFVGPSSFRCAHGRDFMKARITLRSTATGSIAQLQEFIVTGMGISHRFRAI